ncbi:hypothetical protein GMA11_05185 [Granulicatella sp. zg-ZJ]|uniref:hypothetical protein n=1 Tax=Granulicatella sp. zg-ZJ TaxID=2678504 RepID=UPI0013D36500|nr:hypothetical protein [Granulicatella sp. zg-ZJ]MBS4750912.1 hypothetical protein [Carnobacteriaceae bacterium zg-ZUI78]NEW62780.1 hypothetical protein [Granulicatella sp. zg-ZJ]
MKTENIYLVKKIFFTYLAVLSYGIFLCIIFFSFFVKNNDIYFSETSIPESAYHIFLNNFLFFLILLIPIVSPVYFCYAMIFVYAYIVQSVLNFGIYFVLFKLIHYPIEMLAFSIPLSLNNMLYGDRKIPIKRVLIYISFGVALLLIAAIIENGLR